jgi:AcrR family transcriptional regulator
MRQKDEEKKESIKQAVIKLILEQGFHGASIAKIAREAGVSPATVYIYYANKDDMLREIYEEYADQAYFYLLGIINSNMSVRIAGSGEKYRLSDGAFHGDLPLKMAYTAAPCKSQDKFQRKLNSNCIWETIW